MVSCTFKAMRIWFVREERFLTRLMCVDHVESRVWVCVGYRKPIKNL